MCESGITELEIGTAIDQLKNGKSPGIDGISADFYKVFKTLSGSCKIGLKRLKKRHTQSKLHAVLEPFVLYAWFWSLLKGDTPL